MTQKEQVLNALSVIIDPDLGKDIVTLGFIKQLTISDKGEVSFSVELTTPACPVKDMFKKQAEDVVTELGFVSSVNVTMTASKGRLNKPAPKGLKDVKTIIAVSSCKGGVGKSTVSVNLAYSLAKKGAKVGLFDADIYGPSLPTMVHMEDYRLVMDGDLISPLEHHGVSLMSFGYAVASSGESGPAIMRGPMVTQVIQQLLLGTEWGDLDYLVIDFPPGTGDIQLTLAQSVPITASVIVTTPQKISFVDVVKGIKMFDQLKIPTVSVIENMSYFQCDDCTKKHYPYGRGALRSLVHEFGFKLAYEMPIQPEISACGDSGEPFVLGFPDDDVTLLYSQLTDDLVRELSRLQYGENDKPSCRYESGKGLWVSGTTPEPFLLDVYALRCGCQCAICVDEFSNEPKLDPEQVPKDIYPTGVKEVGNYAVGINWSDEHPSLYPYEALLKARTAVTQP